jgi:hypothetical protein
MPENVLAAAVGLQYSPVLARSVSTSKIFGTRPEQNSAHLMPAMGMNNQHMFLQEASPWPDIVSFVHISAVLIFCHLPGLQKWADTSSIGIHAGLQASQHLN